MLKNAVAGLGLSRSRRQSFRIAKLRGGQIRLVERERFRVAGRHAAHHHLSDIDRVPTEVFVIIAQREEERSADGDLVARRARRIGKLERRGVSQDFSGANLVDRPLIVETIGLAGVQNGAALDIENGGSRQRKILDDGEGDSSGKIDGQAGALSDEIIDLKIAKNRERGRLGARCDEFGKSHPAGPGIETLKT